MTPELWLTEIRMNPRDRAVGRDLRSTTQLHRTVMSMFPDTASTSARQSHSVLHRLDSTSAGPVLLVQSGVHPNLTAVPASYGQTRTIALGPLVERLTPGVTIRYRILLNATKKLGGGDLKGKRIALGAQAARGWWVTRSGAAGLTVASDFTMVATTTVGQDSDDGRITIRPWRIDGTASIENPAALTEALVNGVGRGKAYGCGMLSVMVTSSPLRQ